ncbi:histidine ammonia-lyase [Porphyromonas levii]|uniref:histidine ammonia-lyase n=1 Tax=Porphyromonas levii TaxID=28114 RepID=UPI001D2D1D6B|nr:Histidine ammonia-lyase [Porphyromonas levii]MBR8714000.1 Histidine ammonia-lyase [Porphyromonas levii]MBR8716018.1 Histidine ammonia-lyase [Porphyromonas levii]MBR8728547.1 Histidine ammonia-lyase [Porphyromonas levii]MBR8736872.1 Histidine ammonia-lyase [Porphyromonas levii]
MRVVTHQPYTLGEPMEYVIGRDKLTIESLERVVFSKKVTYTLAPEAITRIQKCRDYLDAKVEKSDRPLYGITTGFGSLCSISIPQDDLTKLQENLVMSHSCSYGDEVAEPIVKLMLILKVYALSLGHSGVQVDTVQRLVDMLNEEMYPIVYDKGSLGASGDLAPLAKLFLPLIGEGEVYYKGERMASAEAYKKAGLQTITLKSKEGLALLNGTQFMSSHGVYALMLARRAQKAALHVAALSLEAFDGLSAPFYAGLHTIRPHEGQSYVAKTMRNLLEGSKLQEQAKAQVQDPYSFRCIPQVHGASYDALKYVTSVVETEINSVTDNPTIFPDEDMIVSGGNFHGQPLAIVYDFLAVAMAEIGNISERRTAQLILGLRNLPEFLVAKPGLNSGFMIPQYAAAAMVSQNKMYCFSAASDSIVSSNGQEDHVSMGANAATKLLPLLDNLYAILGVELMNGAQALALRKGADKTSAPLQKLYNDFRKVVPMVQDDVVMYKQMQDAADFVYSYTF